MLHSFEQSIEGIELPHQFTWPFNYVPHPLCRLAAYSTQRYIESRKDWHEELARGKMFGVLVVTDNDGKPGFLAAFSGNLSGRNSHAYFVPPVYDAQRPGDFFRTGEAVISSLNHTIGQLLSSDEMKQATEHLDTISREAEVTLNRMKETMSRHKLLRDMRRKRGDDNAILIAESQREKADYNRAKKRYRSLIDEARDRVVNLTGRINALKEERKTRSAALQMELFRQYRLMNAHGETKDLCEIFAPTPQLIPPAGAGECAAPKLLQYAYLNGLHPIAMAEFWWGESPRGEIRRHGNFYPSCIGKCKPILMHMMQGLVVEPDPMASVQQQFSPEILWEDSYLLIVNKPSGMLSVNGKTGIRSIEQWAHETYCDTMIVHRLDQATSGILVIAKDRNTYHAMQSQFIGHRIKKSYIALLDGIITTAHGEINLPLKQDYNHRPCQMVADDGKKAVTRYEVIGIENGRTRVRLYPITGRTHQLRVHSAHPSGLGTPITGDELYGTPARRLMLHAEQIEFTHPATGKNISITCLPDF